MGSHGNEPVEGLRGRSGPEAVVLLGHGTEGAAEDGRVLVLAHTSNLTTGRNGLSFAPAIGAVKSIAHAEVAQR